MYRSWTRAQKSVLLESTKILFWNSQFRQGIWPHLSSLKKKDFYGFQWNVFWALVHDLYIFMPSYAYLICSLEYREYITIHFEYTWSIYGFLWQEKAFLVNFLKMKRGKTWKSTRIFCHFYCFFKWKLFSNASKKFSTCLMTTFKVFRMCAWMSSSRWWKNRSHTTRLCEDIYQ